MERKQEERRRRRYGWVGDNGNGRKRKGVQMGRGSSSWGRLNIRLVTGFAVITIFCSLPRLIRLF